MDLDFWVTARGNSPIIDYVNELPEKHFKKITREIDRLERLGYELSKSGTLKKLPDQKIFELRIPIGGVTYRILLSISNNQALLLSIFSKKSEKLPQHEIQTALSRLPINL